MNLCCFGFLLDQKPVGKWPHYCRFPSTSPAWGTQEVLSKDSPTEISSGPASADLRNTRMAGMTQLRAPEENPLYGCKNEARGKAVLPRHQPTNECLVDGHTSWSRLGPLDPPGPGICLCQRACRTWGSGEESRERDTPGCHRELGRRGRMQHDQCQGRAS